MMRIAAWSLLLAVTALTFVPALLRPVTGFGHSIEHFAIFFLMGGAFGLAYSRHAWSIGLAMIVCSGALEVLQLLMPGRHARLSDFLIDALGACIGVAVSQWPRVRSLASSG
jgi:VanZ family protein